MDVDILLLKKNQCPFIEILIRLKHCVICISNEGVTFACRAHSIHCKPTYIVHSHHFVIIVAVLYFYSYDYLLEMVMEECSHKIWNFTTAVVSGAISWVKA